MRPPGPFGFLPADACTLTRRVLHDDALQAEFEARGYVVVPFLEPDEVERLVDGYDRIASDLGGSSNAEDYNETYAEFSIIHSKPDFRRAAYDLITSVLVPAADRQIDGYRALIANFVNKPPGTGIVPTHQNFSVVDEAEHRSISVWVALVDCTLENGAMSMLDGSHVCLRSRRGMWAYQAFGGIDQADLDPLLTLLEVPAGHAVILDDAVVHYSPPNQTDQRRLAIQFVMVPEEATPIWFQQTGVGDDGLEVTVWEVDERFFFEFWHGDGDTQFATEQARISLPKADIDLPTLRTLLGGCSTEDVGAAPEGTEPTASVPAAGSESAAAAAASETEAEPKPQRGLRALISRLSR